jgi:predicted small metal-binding protein
MTKSINCADVGVECSWSATAETVDELLAKCQEHANTEHKDMVITPEIVTKIKSHIKEI